MVIKGDFFVYVLEFKIESDVRDHQNPNSPKFAYGGNISNYPEFRNFGKNFIVVTNDDKVEQIKPERRQQDGLFCYWKSWSDLNIIQPTSELVADLFDSFGDLGIEIFRERQLKSMKLTNFAMSSLKVIQILNAVYQNLGYGKLKIENIDDEGKMDEDWWTGVTIKNSTSAEFEGWFGFQGKKQTGKIIPEESGAAVWFYCHDSKTKKDCFQKLLNEKGFKTEEKKDGTLRRCKMCL